MPSIALIAMQRDESELLPIWLGYHAALVGHRGITILDNGSREPGCLQALAQAERQGVRVIREHSGERAFAAKGELVAARIRALEPAPQVVLPLDLDEFIGLRRGETYSCNPAEILGWLATLPPGGAYHSGERLNNCPWEARSYFPMPPDRSPKLLFTTTEEWGLDLGFHRCDRPSPATPSEWVVFHYHNKPFPLLRHHALRKLIPPLPLPSSRCLDAYQGPGDHLLPALLQGERRWLRQLRRQPSRYTAALVDRLQELGLPLPFAVDHPRTQALLQP